MMNRYLAYGNQFFVFVDLLNLFLLEDIKDMGVRGAWKPLQGGCESVYRVSYDSAYFSSLVGDSSGCLNPPGNAYLNRSFFSPVFSRLPSVGMVISRPFVRRFSRAYVFCVSTTECPAISATS